MIGRGWDRCRRRSQPSPLDCWFAGAITDEEARTLEVPLSSLTPCRRYVAEIYADGPNANWLDTPLPVTITKTPVTAAPRRQTGTGRWPGDSNSSGTMNSKATER
jgi:hypothetical protein